MTICGLIQKFNYSPADDLKEIWGIWDTPEPRYYFASFTYKNHWSCFAILSIFLNFCMIFKNFNKKRDLLINLKRNTLSISSVLIIYSSIPISGSRSGTIFASFYIIMFIIYLLFKKYDYKFLKISKVFFILIFISISFLFFYQNF